jgi:general stress protein 26
MEIASNPRVELCYLDEQHDQVRITGFAEVVTDQVLLGEIWSSNPLLRKYLGTPENPELIIYCIRPERVRYMREWALRYEEVPLPA